MGAFETLGKASPAAQRLTSKGQNPLEKSVWKPHITTYSSDSVLGLAMFKKS
jgi:hypothetical protein